MSEHERPANGKAVDQVVELCDLAAELVRRHAPGRGGRGRSGPACTARCRVAIAGRVKAGKSTLLNALVGERLAATDAGECTRLVTWYQDGVTYDVQAVTRDGSPPSAAVPSGRRRAAHRPRAASTPAPSTASRSPGRRARCGT